MRRGSCLAALVVVIAATLASAPSAPAAPEPGTPLAVAPGVPGHGRAWELVTSPDPVSGFLFELRAISTNGNRLAYATVGQLPDAPLPVPLGAPAIAVRGADGWTNATDWVPFPEVDLEPMPLAMTPDFENSIWRIEQPDRTYGFFRRTPDGEFTPTTNGTTFFDEPFGPIRASADLQHFILGSDKHLLAADASRTAGSSIYEVVGSAVRLVDVGAGGALLSDCGSTTGKANSISRDGQRIFFVTSPGCTGPKRVYLRANGATTTEISASQCDLADCGPVADVAFVGATPTGSSAFLVTEERLTDDDSNAHADLYRYDVSAGDLTLVSSSWAGGDLIPTTKSVYLPAGGSRVYFGAAEQTGPGTTGPPTLYMADAGGVHLVGAGALDGFVQLSANGRYALFLTSAQLVAADSDEKADVYRYDAEGGTLIRISAGSQGGNGPYEAKITFNYSAQVVVGNPPRGMTDDASRIFFDTAERLLPEDSNDASDVYEWENGDLALLSAGAGNRGAIYEGSVPDGSTVFFRTAETLLAGDRDGGEADFYAARVGGGFPETSPPQGCGSCSSAPRGRAERAIPVSAGSAGRRIRLGRIGAAARRQIVATGWIELLAEVPKAGKLAARARARVRNRERTVAAASVTVPQAGPVRLRMRLSKEARGQLAMGRNLRVHLSVRLSRLSSIRRASFELKARP